MSSRQVSKKMCGKKIENQNVFHFLPNIFLPDYNDKCGMPVTPGERHCSLSGFQDIPGTGNRLHFLRVQLIKQASFAEVEGSSWLTIGTVSLRSIVEAPACCAAGDRQKPPKVCKVEFNASRVSKDDSSDWDRLT